MKWFLFAALVACKYDGPVKLSPDAPAPPVDSPQVHTWSDAYTMAATGDCMHTATCDPSLFSSMYSSQADCVTTTVGNDCDSFYDPVSGENCMSTFPESRWSQVLECESQYVTLACSVEWPTICLQALNTD